MGYFISDRRSLDGYAEKYALLIDFTSDFIKNIEYDKITLQFKYNY